MKKLLCFFLFIICMGNTKAQKWAPIGAKWTYSFLEGLGSFMRSYPVLWETKDTITIQGKLCSITCPKTSSGVWLTDTSDMFRTMITYEDSGKVYWYVPDSAFFTVLYDFNKNVDESWVIRGMHYRTASSSCPLKVTVVSVGMDTINGIPLKSMVIKDPTSMPVFRGKIIQGIGHLELPRPIPARVCATPSDVEDYDGLRCIDIPGIGFHDFKREPTCDYVRTSVNEYNQSNPEIKLFPNPSSNYYEIEYNNEDHSPTSISITDLSGRSLAQYPLPQGKSHIEASSWASGLYFYSIRQGGKTLYNGKIIKQ